jgi:hypothetical protein
MNKEHYRLEAMKLAMQAGINRPYEEIAERFYNWIMQDVLIAEKAKQEEENKPLYKVRPPH